MTRQGDEHKKNVRHMLTTAGQVIQENVGIPGHTIDFYVVDPETAEDYWVLATDLAAHPGDSLRKQAGFVMGIQYLHNYGPRVLIVVPLMPLSGVGYMIAYQLSEQLGAVVMDMDTYPTWIKALRDGQE